MSKMFLLISLFLCQVAKADSQLQTISSPSELKQIKGEILRIVRNPEHVSNEYAVTISYFNPNSESAILTLRKVLDLVAYYVALSTSSRAPEHPLQQTYTSFFRENIPSGGIPFFRFGHQFMAKVLALPQHHKTIPFLGLLIQSRRLFWNKVIASQILSPRTSFPIGPTQKILTPIARAGGLRPEEIIGPIFQKYGDQPLQMQHLLEILIQARDDHGLDVTPIFEQIDLMMKQLGGPRADRCRQAVMVLRSKFGHKIRLKI